MGSVFSAPNYLDTGGNKAAILKFTPTGPGGSLVATPSVFTAVPHPDLPAMHYQNFIIENLPHLTRQMKKKVVSTGDDFGEMRGPLQVLPIFLARRRSVRKALAHVSDSCVVTHAD